MQWKPHDITSLLLFKIIERIYKDSVAYAVEDIALKKLKHVICITNIHGQTTSWYC